MQPAILLDLSVSPSQDTLPRRRVDLAASPAVQAPPAFLRLNPAGSPLEPAPPLPEPAFASPQAVSPSVIDFLMNIANDVFSPLALRQDGRFVAPGASFFLCAGLAAFLFWAGYFAVPAISELLPLSSPEGMGYVALLAPASLMASCLALSMGRLGGRLIGSIAARFSRQNSRVSPTENASASPTLSELIKK